MKTLIIPAICERLATRKDKTISVTFGTQELSPEKSAELFSISQQYCFLAIKRDDFTQKEKEIVENVSIDDDLKTDKTPSQRLRSVLYILYTQKPDGYKDFREFYNAKMDGF